MEAWCRSRIVFTIGKPSPVPLSPVSVFVVKKGWKILSINSGAIPAPVSAMRTTILLPSAEVCRLICKRFSFDNSMACAALTIRLRKTCSKSKKCPQYCSDNWEKLKMADRSVGSVNLTRICRFYSAASNTACPALWPLGGGSTWLPQGRLELRCARPWRQPDGSPSHPDSVAN